MTLVKLITFQAADLAQPQDPQSLIQKQNEKTDIYFIDIQCDNNYNNINSKAK